MQMGIRLRVRPRIRRLQGNQFRRIPPTVFRNQGKEEQENCGESEEGGPDQRGKEEEGKDTHTVHVQGKQACRQGVAHKGQAP